MRERGALVDRALVGDFAVVDRGMLVQDNNTRDARGRAGRVRLEQLQLFSERRAQSRVGCERRGLSVEDGIERFIADTKIEGRTLKSAK